VGERHDMGVTQHQVVGRHHDHEHADHAQGGKCPGTGEQERPQRQAQEHQQQHHGERTAARIISGKQGLQPLNLVESISLTG